MGGFCLKREEAFMSNNLTLSPDFMIRSPQKSTEIEEFFRLNAQVFRSDENTDIVANQRYRFIIEDPDFRTS